MPSQLNRSHLLRLGAAARLEELRAEIAALEAEFPDLRAGRQPQTGNRRSRKAASVPQPVATASEESASKPGRRGWTAAQRKAAGDRMKAYWAKRKAGRKK